MGTRSFVPKDIVADILTRIPVKSLIRFKCLSKFYCDLIESPSFIATHLHHSIHNPSLIVLNRKSLESGASLLHNNETTLSGDLFTPFVQDQSSLMTVGSCHGLVCVYQEKKFILWNPATRQFRLLPPARLSLDFYADHSRVGLGFGFDPQENDYKIVRVKIVVYVHAGVSVQVQVFKQSKNSWREINYDRPDNVYEWRRFPYSVTCAVGAKGELYWMTDNNMLLSFSMFNEIFQWISIPPDETLGPVDQGPWKKNICVWKESLAMLAYHYLGSLRDQLDLWVLNGSGKDRSWSKIFIINPLNPITRELGVLCDINVGVVIRSLQVHEVFENFEDSKHFEAFNCVESLVPV